MSEIAREAPCTRCGELEQVKRERDLATGQLLMVGSEIAADPKLDPMDYRDPRWTPTLEEAAKLRADNERLRGALERLYKQTSAHWASMSIAAELDAARAALAGEQVPDADAEARSDWHHGYPAGALLRLVAYALRECGYALCRTLADAVELRASTLHWSAYDVVSQLCSALLLTLRTLYGSGSIQARADYLLCRLAAKQPDWIETMKRRKHWLTSALAGVEEVEESEGEAKQENEAACHYCDYEDQEPCFSAFFGYFYCTRPKGHDGVHVACSESKHAVAMVSVDTIPEKAREP